MKKTRTQTSTSVNEWLGLPESWPIVEDPGYPVVLFPNAKDIKTARRCDVQGCALHNAACRMYDIKNCAVGASFAYIPQKDSKGNWFIARYRPNTATIKAIKEFDKTGAMPEGGFKFLPCSPGRTLEYMRRYRQSYLRNPNRPPSKYRKKRATPARLIPGQFSRKGE